MATETNSGEIIAKIPSDLLMALEEYMSRDDILIWWISPNEVCDNLTPREFIKRNGEKGVKKILDEFQKLQTGEPL